MPFELVEPEVSATTRCTPSWRCSPGRRRARRWRSCGRRPPAGGAAQLPALRCLRGGADGLRRARLSGVAAPVRRRAGAAGTGHPEPDLGLPRGRRSGRPAEAVYLHLCDVLRAALTRSAWRRTGRRSTGRSATAASISPGAGRCRAQDRGHGAILAPRAGGAGRSHPGACGAGPCGAGGRCRPEIHRRANGFEARLGSGRHYDPAAVVSVRQAIEAGGASAAARLPHASASGCAPRWRSGRRPAKRRAEVGGLLPGGRATGLNARAGNAGHRTRHVPWCRYCRCRSTGRRRSAARFLMEDLLVVAHDVALELQPAAGLGAAAADHDHLHP